jgi:hypothetical protein
MSTPKPMPSIAHHLLFDEGLGGVLEEFVLALLMYKFVKNVLYSTLNIS